MTPTPHDALFKSVFSDPERAAELLAFTLGPAIAARIDWTTLRREHASFIDDGLRASHVDLLFTAALAGRLCKLHILYEHQSTEEWAMALRTLGYKQRIWNAHLADHPESRTLPAILTCVLHHSEKGWRAATTFESLIDLPGDADEAIWSYVPRFRYALVDIGAAGVSLLTARALSAFVRLTLRILLEARSAADIETLLASWIELLSEVARDPTGRGALRPIFRYLSQVRSRGDHHAIVTTAREVTKDQEDHMETIADMFIEQGLKKGLKQGREEGRKEMEPRLRKALVITLRARFGRLPKTALTRIQQADMSTLDRWIDHASAARSLAALLDG